MANHGNKVANLETIFGDPTREGGGFTHRVIVEADANRNMVAVAAHQLDTWGFGSEFVPVSRGGRWASTEDMVRRLLPIFRRDPALGLGHGITTLMAAANVWVSGDDEMQRRLATRLRAGQRIAVGFHELSHGNDLLQNECTALRVETPLEGWRVDGRKEVINNVDRAESVLLFARTGQEPGPRSFSLLLWHKDQTLGGHSDTARRILTSGMRGCLIGAAELDALLIPDSSLVGDEGSGVTTALRAFQITRSVVPALATGIVDAAIRLAVRYMRERSLYSGAVWDLPHARMLLSRAWAALLIADCFARAAVRTLHVRPDESFLASAASKYLVPVLLNDAMEDLSILFGSSFYAITPSYGIFEKWLRDLIVVPIGHAGSTSCLLTLIPNLPTWARRTRRDVPYEPLLFSAEGELAEMVFDALGLGAGRVDSLTAPLNSETVLNAFREDHPALMPIVDAWRKEWSFVRDEALALPVSSLGPDAPPEVFELAGRLAAAMAAGAVLGTWFEGRGVSTSPFSGSSAAITAVLHSLFDRLGPRVTEPANGEVERRPSPKWTQPAADAAAAHVARRVDAGRSLGAEELPVA